LIPHIGGFGVCGSLGVFGSVRGFRAGSIAANLNHSLSDQVDVGYPPYLTCVRMLQPEVELQMIPDTASHPSSLGAMMVRGALMAVLTAVSWSALFIVMGVSAFSAVLAVVIAGGFRLLCFGLPLKKRN
jgi:hypothetical protein